MFGTGMGHTDGIFQIWRNLNGVGGSNQRHLEAGATYWVIERVAEPKVQGQTKDAFCCHERSGTRVEAGYGSLLTSSQTEMICLELVDTGSMVRNRLRLCQGQEHQVAWPFWS